MLAANEVRGKQLDNRIFSYPNNCAISPARGNFLSGNQRPMPYLLLKAGPILDPPRLEEVWPMEVALAVALLATAVNKHLIPVYDDPMIQHPLSAPVMA